MKFKQLQIDSVSVFYPAGEEESANTMISVYKDVARLLTNELHLIPPRRLRLYVVTSWIAFIFHSPPFYLKFLWGILLPFYFRNIVRSWKWIAGWTLLRPSSRPVIGVKPPWLIARSDRTIGKHIFYKVPEQEQFKQTVCHELVHAFTTHLKLPFWLNEGLAMWFVDKWVGNQTVKPSTLAIVSIHEPRQRVISSAWLPYVSKEDVVYHYARAYWIVRFLHEKDVKLLPQFIERRMSHRSLEKRLAQTIGLSRKKLWREIDRLLYDHFNQDGMM